MNKVLPMYDKLERLEKRLRDVEGYHERKLEEFELAMAKLEDANRMLKEALDDLERLV